MADEYQFLHPLVHVVRIDETRTQLRLPDGESLTLTSDGFPLPEFLDALRTGTQSLGQHPLRATFDSYETHCNRLIEMLRERHALIEGDQRQGPVDTLHMLLNYVSDRSMRSSPLQRDDGLVSVVGVGVIADAARCVMAKTGQLAKQADAFISLSIVCADFDDFSLFGAENEKMVERNMPVLFVWKSGARILLGPLVRPHQSACFHCYFERRASNTLFIDEFEALVGQRDIDAPPLDDSMGLIGGLVEFLLARHVKLIMDKVANLVMPGNVYTYHLVSGTTQTHPVVKLPRCAVCGGAREDKLVRAVRDLL
jgi:bacteriocin biosynthesis cyclodehydratase domain-containing protein